MMALNVVWQIAAGERFNFDEEGMKLLLHQQQSINEIFWSITFSALTPLPILRHFYPMKSVVVNAKREMAALRYTPAFFFLLRQIRYFAFLGNSTRKPLTNIEKALMRLISGM